MSTLDVPGARLHYEAHGSGPLMLMVPGASGEAGVFERVTEYLPRTTPSAPTTDAASPAATSTGHRTTTVGSRPTPTMPGA
jgi:pimeloyl-ACP methyl ester carboxylesterase